MESRRDIFAGQAMAALCTLDRYEMSTATERDPERDEIMRNALAQASYRIADAMCQYAEATLV